VHAVRHRSQECKGGVRLDCTLYEGVFVQNVDFSYSPESPNIKQRGNGYNHGHQTPSLRFKLYATSALLPTSVETNPGSTQYLFNIRLHLGYASDHLRCENIAEVCKGLTSSLLLLIVSHDQFHELSSVNIWVARSLDELNEFVWYVCWKASRRACEVEEILDKVFTVQSLEPVASWELVIRTTPQSLPVVSVVQDSRVPAPSSCIDC
jgi:hypothetical protein